MLFKVNLVDTKITEASTREEEYLERRTDDLTNPNPFPYNETINECKKIDYKNFISLNYVLRILFSVIVRSESIAEKRSE